jgi:hypothetical protein
VRGLRDSVDGPHLLRLALIKLAPTPEGLSASAPRDVKLDLPRKIDLYLSSWTTRQSCQSGVKGELTLCLLSCPKARLWTSCPKKQGAHPSTTEEAQPK